MNFSIFIFLCLPPSSCLRYRSVGNERPVLQLSGSLARVLSESVQVNAAGSVTRLTGAKRPYNMVNRAKRTPAKPTKAIKTPFASIESLVDGSAFVTETPGPVAVTGRCCKSKCHQVWAHDKLQRARDSIVPYGPGSQSARKSYVRECIAAETRQLHIRDGQFSNIPVCWVFYRALMGVSFNLIQAAGSLGSVAM